MSVKSPVKSDIQDRHEVVKTEIEIGVRELEFELGVQSKYIKDGALSREALEILRVFREDLEKTSEFMTHEDFRHYVKKKVREQIIKIRLLKKKENDNKKKGKKKDTSSTVVVKTPFEENVDMSTMKTVDKANKGAPQTAKPSAIAKQSTPLTNKVASEKTVNQGFRGHDANRMHESRPERPLPPAASKPKTTLASAMPNKAAVNTLGDMGKSKAIPQQRPPATPQPIQKPTNQTLPSKPVSGQPAKEPLKIKIVIPAPKKGEVPSIRPFKPAPVLPPGYDAGYDDIEIVSEAGGRPAVHGNNRAEPQQPTIPDTYEPDDDDADDNNDMPGQLSNDDGYGDGDDPGGAGNGGRPPGQRHPKIGAPKPGRIGKLANNPAVKRALGATPWGRAALLALEVRKRKKEALILLLIVVGAAAGILFLFIVIIGRLGEEEELARKAKEAEANAAAPLTISKKGPTTGATNTEITYEINASYPGTAQDVIIRDTLPQGVAYAPKDCNVAKFDPNTRTVTWSAREILSTRGQNPSGMISNINIAIKLTVRILPEANNKHIINQAIGEVVGAQGGGAAPGGGTVEGYVPPNDNNCGGKYSGNISKNRFLKKNFGDPNCTQNVKAEIDKRIQQPNKDPGNAAWWFQVIKCESGYNPNAWRDPDTVTHTPDAGGAWGLFQVGSSIIAQPESLYSNSKGRPSVQMNNIKQQPGLPGGTWGHGGEYDRGDLNWEVQIDNAIQLLKKRGKGYWACA